MDPNQSMNPFDALKFLNDACGQVTANRDGHIRIQAAVNTIAEALQNAATVPPAAAPNVMPLVPRGKRTPKGKNAESDAAAPSET